MSSTESEGISTAMDSEIELIELIDSDDENNNSSKSSIESDIDEAMDSDNESINSDLGTDPFAFEPDVLTVEDSDEITCTSTADESKLAESIQQGHETTITTTIAAKTTTTYPVYYNPATLTFYPSTGVRPIHPDYLTCAQEEPKTMLNLQTILVILDLNGTMMHRVAGRKCPMKRPHFNDFIRFLLQNFRVMIWSSARADTVKRLLKQFPTGTKKKLDRVWSREDLRLSKGDFERKVLTLKDLDFIWEVAEQEREEFFQDLDENQRQGKLTKSDFRKFETRFDQRNTVLIDDSIHKTQLQPHNSIVLRDYDSTHPDAEQDQELLKVRDYLIGLRSQENLSSFMRTSPFDSSNPVYQGADFKARIEEQDRQMASGGWRNPEQEAKEAEEAKAAKAARKLENQVAEYRELLTKKSTSLSESNRLTLNRKFYSLGQSLVSKGVNISSLVPAKEEIKVVNDEEETEPPAMNGGNKPKPKRKKNLRRKRQRLLLQQQQLGIDGGGSTTTPEEDETLSASYPNQGNKHQLVGDILMDVCDGPPSDQPLSERRRREPRVGDLIFDEEPRRKRPLIGLHNPPNTEQLEPQRKRAWNRLHNRHNAK